MPSTNEGWSECVTCRLALLVPDMEEHIREKHKFECFNAVNTKTPFIREGKLTAKLHTINDVGIKPKNDSIKNNILYLNPDTMQTCKYKRGQPILLNNRILLETYCDRCVPLGSVVVSNDNYNILNGESQMVELQNPMMEQLVSAWICYVTISYSNNFDDPSCLLSIPQLFSGKKFICEDESFAVNCFGNVATINIQSVISKRNFDSETIGNITSALSSLSLCQKQKQLYLITEYTKFKLVTECKRKKLKLNFIHGMDEAKNILMLAIKRFYSGTSLVFDRGCIIHGVQGSGKSSLVEAMAEHFGLPLISPDFSNIFSLDMESFVNNLNFFENQVFKSSPCFVCFDNIENFCPIQVLTSHPDGYCIAEHFNTFLHSLSQMRCFIFGITKDINLLSSSLSFFEMVLEIPVPSAMDRFEILTGLMKHYDIHCCFKDDEIKRAADVAHGFSGCDLNRICLKLKTSSQSGREITEDLLNLVHKTVPSILREVAIESPNVKWEDVGGQEKLKEVLKWSIEKPIENSSLFEGNIMKGILLYGPPGCSKTMIVKALATECKLNFLWVQGSQLHGKYVGESEQAIRELFKKARNAAPCVIFFDELDVFAPKRGSGRDTAGVSDRCVSLLMTEIDGISGLKNVFIISATNRPDHIDPALLRAGRFDTRFYVPLPNLDTRMKILQVRCNKGNVDEDVDVKLLAEKTERFSCAEVASLYEFAGNAAITEDEHAKKIKMKHFTEALSNMVPLTNPELLECPNRDHQRVETPSTNISALYSDVLWGWAAPGDQLGVPVGLLNLQILTTQF